MVTCFNSKIARTEEGFEELMQVVQAHRRKFCVKTKSDLQSYIVCKCCVNYYYLNFKS